MSPLRPEDEARMASLSQALEGVPLPVATAAVESGRVLNARTGRPAEWAPVATVLPVSERLRGT